MAAPETLANDARCYDCNIPGGMLLAVMAYILQQTLDSIAVSADPSVLANAARCYDCVGTTPGMIIKELVDLNAAIIAGGGGGAGTTQVYTGAAPPAAPADPTKAALFYPTGGGQLSQWSIGGAAWV